MTARLKEWLLFVVIVGLLGVIPVRAAEQAPERTNLREAAELVSALRPAPRVYSDLTEVVERVCGEAILQFRDFYGKSPVTIRPFEFIDEFRARRLSFLGAILADQMGAKISNYARARPFSRSGTGQEQWLKGGLQEIGGYLRIHIRGGNLQGDRRSYVVNVEMSEALYRALHTYIRG